jgi:type II secretory pathway pseudopilin PulG
MQLMHRARGFTLTELAVVFAVVALLIGGAMMTLSAQVEQRNLAEVQHRLDAAAEAVHAFAIVNRRVPCPARWTSSASHSQGSESFCTLSSGTCAGSETTTVQGHGNCSNFYDGYLPAVSLGVTPTDSDGFAVDVWGNRLRYVVARDVTACSVTPPAGTRVFTSQANLRTYGITCRPNDLDICTSAACTSRVISTQTALFVVYSTGQNGNNTAGYGADETENTDGDAVFVSRTQAGAQSSGGTFDDLIGFVPVGMVYGKLVAAGILP